MEKRWRKPAGRPERFAILIIDRSRGRQAGRQAARQWRRLMYGLSLINSVWLHSRFSTLHFGFPAVIGTCATHIRSTHVYTIYIYVFITRGRWGVRCNSRRRKRRALPPSSGGGSKRVGGGCNSTKELLHVENATAAAAAAAVHQTFVSDGCGGGVGGGGGLAGYARTAKARRAHRHVPHRANKARLMTRINKRTLTTTLNLTATTINLCTPAAHLPFSSPARRSDDDEDDGKKIDGSHRKTRRRRRPSFYTVHAHAHHTSCVFPPPLPSYIHLETTRLIFSPFYRTYPPSRPTQPFDPKRLKSPHRDKLYPLHHHCRTRTRFIMTEPERHTGFARLPSSVRWRVTTRDFPTEKNRPPSEQGYTNRGNGRQLRIRL